MIRGGKSQGDALSGLPDESRIAFVSPQREVKVGSVSKMKQFICLQGIALNAWAAAGLARILRFGPLQGAA